MTTIGSESTGRPRKRHREDHLSRYCEFDSEKSWEVFVLPNSKLTVEDAKERNRLASSKDINLSDAEEAERKRWRDLRETLLVEIPVVINNIEEFLECRVLAPILLDSKENVSRPSSSKDRRERLFPPKNALLEWDDFDKNVSQFKPSASADGKYKDTWGYSAGDDLSLKNEEEEKAWINSNVINRLHHASLLCRENHSAENALGMPDMSLYGGSTDLQCIIATIEVKSTHNLWLPPLAESIVENFNESLDGDHALFFCVAHVIGQVCRTMIVNEVTHGAITSSTRTHFVRFMVESDKATMLISRRWYVGEPNYLRAWAWFSQSAREEAKKPFPEVHFRKWSNASPPRKPKRRSARLAGQESISKPVVNVLRIDWEDIEFTGVVLGYGRHGSVHEARWGYETVAIKIFDIDHGAEDAFERELSAYIKLKEVQGLLIPKLHFWTRHWTGSLFALGLQLGRSEPACGRHDVWIEKEAVLEGLRERGYSHTDSDDLRNFVYIDNGCGGDRLVAIDLESIEPDQLLSPLTELTEDNESGR